MARKTSTGLPGLKHRTLITVEAVLAVGLLQELLGQAVQRAQIANLFKVLFIMATVVGLFGGLILVVQSAIGGGVGRAFDAARGLPVPLLHLCALLVLLWCYSRVWALPLW